MQHVHLPEAEQQPSPRAADRDPQAVTVPQDAAPDHPEDECQQRSSGQSGGHRRPRVKEPHIDVHSCAEDGPEQETEAADQS